MTEEFPIQGDIPLPKAVVRNGTKYPWPNMKTGDSIIVEKQYLDRIRTAAYDWARRHDAAFRSGKDEQGAYRIWRVR
jgi:hypothetical protein